MGRYSFVRAGVRVIRAGVRVMRAGVRVMRVMKQNIKNCENS